MQGRSLKLKLVSRLPQTSHASRSFIGYDIQPRRLTFHIAALRFALGDRHTYEFVDGTLESVATLGTPISCSARIPSKLSEYLLQKISLLRPCLTAN